MRVIVNFISRDKEAFLKSAKQVESFNALEVFLVSVSKFVQGSVMHFLFLLQIVLSSRKEPGCLVTNLYKEMGSTSEPGTTRWD